MYQKRKKKHRLSKQEWKSCKEYFNNECAYCGLPIEEHFRKYAGKLQKIDFQLRSQLEIEVRNL